MTIWDTSNPPFYNGKIITCNTSLTGNQFDPEPLLVPKKKKQGSKFVLKFSHVSLELITDLARSVVIG